MLFFYKVNITDIVILDLRNLAIICAAALGGPAAPIVAALIIGSSRILFYGFAKASIVSLISAPVIGAFCAYTTLSKYSQLKKFLIMLAFSLCFTSIALTVIIEEKEILPGVLGYCWGIYILASVPVFSALEYLTNVNARAVRQKATEQELRLSNAKFRAIFDNAGIGFTLRDLEGNTVEANPFYLNMLGFSSKEELPNLSDLIHPDDLGEEEGKYAALLSGECSSYRLESRYRSSNGRTIYCDVITTPIPGSDTKPPYVLRAYSDISNGKKLEETLRESEKRFRTAFNNAAVGMCLLSLNGNFMKVNGALCKIIGYSRDELSNMTVHEIIHRDFAYSGVDLMGQLARSEIPYFHT